MAACTSCSNAVSAWDVHYLRSFSIIISFLYHKHLESDDGRLHQLQHCGLCVGRRLNRTWQEKQERIDISKDVC